MQRGDGVHCHNAFAFRLDRELANDFSSVAKTRTRLPRARGLGGAEFLTTDTRRFGVPVFAVWRSQVRGSWI